MTRKNPRAGEGPCPVCTRPVIYRASTTGKLSLSCQWCDFSGYADPDGRAHKMLTAKLTPEADDPDNKPAPTTKPAPPPAPERKPASIFSLGDV